MPKAELTEAIADTLTATQKLKRLAAELATPDVWFTKGRAHELVADINNCLQVVVSNVDILEADDETTDPV